VGDVRAGLDLDAYFERIGWRGEARPRLEVLAGLLDAHMLRVPFENLDVLLGRGVRIDLESVQAKLVGARRGGYCFEHATLFFAVLEVIGFRPLRHAARVVLFAPRAASMRTHMFLCVPLPEGRFVVDPGFGALVPRLPLALIEGVNPRPIGATHWLARDGAFWALRTTRDGGEVDVWLSTLEEENPADFEVANHYTATHPASPFVNRIMLRAFTAGGAVTVMNRDVTLWHGNSGQTSQLADRGALRELLRADFGFDLAACGQLRVPAIPEWR
jgi:N-hydroxyarylamine O-acetyltransferase